MKKTVLAGLMTLSLMASSAFAADKLVKRCQTTLSTLDEESIPVEMDFKIVKRDGKLLTIFTQTMSGFVTTQELTAETSSYKIREGLLNNMEDLNDEQLEQLNPGELLILHAMAFDGDPEMNKSFNSGIKDLSKVRKVNTFLMAGDPNDLGSTTIIEAFDAKGKIMGSFLGGFLVSACK